MNIHTGIIKRESIDEDLINMFSFDLDLTGENGTEFMEEEAVKLNMTGLEYFIHLANKENLEGEDKIRFVTNKVSRFYEYNEELETDILVIDNSTFVAVFGYTDCY